MALVTARARRVWPVAITRPGPVSQPTAHCPSSREREPRAALTFSSRNRRFRRKPKEGLECRPEAGPCAGAGQAPGGSGVGLPHDPGSRRVSPFSRRRSDMPSLRPPVRRKASRLGTWPDHPEVRAPREAGSALDGRPGRCPTWCLPRSSPPRTPTGMTRSRSAARSRTRASARSTQPFQVAIYASPQQQDRPLRRQAGRGDHSGRTGPGESAPVHHLGQAAGQLPSRVCRPTASSSWMRRSIPKIAIQESNKRNNQGIGVGYDVAEGPDQGRRSPPTSSTRRSESIPPTPSGEAPLAITAQVKNNVAGGCPGDEIPGGPDARRGDPGRARPT